MMGSGERGVSICFTTLRVCALRLWTLNEIAWPIVPTGSIRFTLAGEFVAATADLAPDIGLARLVACCGQAEKGADVAGSPEAVRPVDRGAEGKRGDRSDARNAHQPPTDLLPTDDVENLLCQAGELLLHRGEDCKERLDERHHKTITVGEVAHSAGKSRAARRAELDAAFAQDRSHHVLDRPHLVQNRAPCDQKRAP